MPETADNRDIDRTARGEAPAVSAVRPDRPESAPAWQDVIALSIDLARAIEAAARNDALSGLEGLVLYLHYGQGWEIDRIAKRLDISYGRARQALQRALQAIQQTGLLQGYDD